MKWSLLSSHLAQFRSFWNNRSHTASWNIFNSLRGHFSLLVLIRSPSLTLLSNMSWIIRGTYASVQWNAPGLRAQTIVFHLYLSFHIILLRHIAFSVPWCWNLCLHTTIFTFTSEPGWYTFLRLTAQISTWMPTRYLECKRHKAEFFISSFASLSTTYSSLTCPLQREPPAFH